MTASNPLLRVPVLTSAPYAGRAPVIETYVTFDRWQSAVEYMTGVVIEDVDRVRALAMHIVRDVDRADRLGQLRALHDWRAANIRYEQEAEEAISRPHYTIAAGVGDCEDHAMLGAAFALALPGTMAALVAMGGDQGATPPGDHPEHLSLLVTHLVDPSFLTIGRAPQWMPLDAPRAPRGWHFSETGVPIATRFGETPDRIRERIPDAA